MPSATRNRPTLRGSRSCPRCACACDRRSFRRRLRCGRRARASFRRASGSGTRCLGILEGRRASCQLPCGCRRRSLSAGALSGGAKAADWAGGAGLWAAGGGGPHGRGSLWSGVLGGRRLGVGHVGQGPQGHVDELVLAIAEQQKRHLVADAVFADGLREGLGGTSPGAPSTARMRSPPMRSPPLILAASAGLSGCTPRTRTPLAKEVASGTPWMPSQAVGGTASSGTLRREAADRAHGHAVRDGCARLVAVLRAAAGDDADHATGLVDDGRAEIGRAHARADLDHVAQQLVVSAEQTGARLEGHRHAGELAAGRSERADHLVAADGIAIRSGETLLPLARLRHEQREVPRAVVMTELHTRGVTIGVAHVEIVARAEGREGSEDAAVVREHAAEPDGLTAALDAHHRALCPRLWGEVFLVFPASSGAAAAVSSGALRGLRTSGPARPSRPLRAHARASLRRSRRRTSPGSPGGACANALHECSAISAPASVSPPNAQRVSPRSGPKGATRIHEVLPVVSRRPHV
jgi:hypothetical protein